MAQETIVFVSDDSERFLTAETDINANFTELYSGKVPGTRNLTINGVTQDLSADRTFTVTDANLSTSDVTTNDVSITKHGFVPKAPNDTAKFLRGDGTWAVPAAGGLSDGDKGDITVSSSGTVWTIDNNAVTDAKINDVDGSKITQSASYRLVTDTEKTTWNNKLDLDGGNANTDIDIDPYSFNAKSIHVKGTGGAGHLGLKHQIGSITATTNESTLGANSSGNPVWKNDGNAIQNIMLENAAITGATKTKITYDSKGLVTSGADATTADIADSTNKRYVTDAQLTVIGNTSGTNTGDETTATLKTKLGAASTISDGYLSSADFTTFNNKQAALTNPVTGTGTNNEIAAFNSTGSTITSLTTATYPSLTELSRIKGLSSAVQTQIDGKQSTLVSATNIKTVFGGTLLGSGDAGITPTAYGGTGVDNSTGGTANTFWARPNGATGAASYRAIVAADIPTLNQNTTGSAASLTTARLINGVSFNGTADISTEAKISMYQGMGSVIKATSLCRNLESLATTGAALANQSVLWLATWLPVSATITGVKWYQFTQGNYTANNYNGVGLYSYSGGTLTLVASSTDDGNIWKATGATWSSKAFSSTYAATAGLYFISLLWCRSAQTTAPSLGVYSAGTNTMQTIDFTNSTKTVSLLAAQTSFPSSQAMSGTNTNGSLIGLGLY